VVVVQHAHLFIRVQLTTTKKSLNLKSA